MNRSRRVLSAFLLAVLAVLGSSLAGSAGAAELDGPVSIVYDAYRVPTIVAQTEHDAIYLQGYMHAKDRLFQMDFLRRVFSGQVAELVGQAGLPQDVQLRTLGLRRAAVRSLPVQTPEVIAWLEAYSDGVNAYLQDTSQPLPIEYGALGITRSAIPAWTPTDSLVMVKGLAWQLSFDLSDIDRTLGLLNFLPVCGFLGCNGLQLATSDLYRTAPFEAVLSIPPSPPPPSSPGGNDPTTDPPADEELPAYLFDANFQTLTQAYRDEIAAIPLLAATLEHDQNAQGSNWWVVSGALTESGYPMIANDPHLSLGTPATFYEIHLNVTGGMNVTGVSFPGAPGVVLGCNDEICWGATVNAMDVTDVYQEILIPTNPAIPTTPTHTLWNGTLEPLQFIPQTFLFNAFNGTLVDAQIPPDAGGVTLIVPRRNDGPIVSVLLTPSAPNPGAGLSVQYTGWGPTQELETFRRFATAGTMQEFKDALQYFDVGSQNWAYADIHGNIAYYTSGELPIREDLQTLFFPDGLQYPGFIRDGTNDNKHEWMTLQNPQPNQALSTEILPFAEMPQIENPAAGYIINANNDPIGTTFDNLSWNQFRAGFNGVLYLSSGYATGYRQGRLQRLFDDILGGGGKMSQAESIGVQANNQLLDAEILGPYLQTAYANATAPGAHAALAAYAGDAQVAEAIARLAAWDFSTPTGIIQGFDPGDNPFAPVPPSQAEIDASVAATIHAAWRGQLVQRVVDTTLATLPIPLIDFTPPSDQAMALVRRLLDRYSINGGTGVSLLNFFNVPGVADQDVARDVILLQALRDGLDLLASPAFEPAFGLSTNLEDYRWGKLHRIVFASFLGGPLDIPPPAPYPGSEFNLAPDLPGFSRAGGMGALDASSHSARADGLHEFMFDSGPSRRLIATMEPDGPDVLEVIPGGESGIPGSPHQIDQLFLWLVNANKPLPVSLDDVNALAVETQLLVCGDGIVGPGEACDDGNTDDADGCNQNCDIVPAVVCLEPVAAADPQTCDATIACEAIASCVDPAGGSVTFTCSPGSLYGLGTTGVTVQCDGATASSARNCGATVEDVTPPTISVSVSPEELWPPNHHMSVIDATVTASDSCSATTVVLDSIVSSELDDAPGDGDGATVDDIQEADLGTEDLQFELRAERAGNGTGRIYTVTYVVTDAFGNTASGVAFVTVAHDHGGMTEPLMMTFEKAPTGVSARWTAVEYATSYNVVRGDLDTLTERMNFFELGIVSCIESFTIDSTTMGFEDTAIPEPGRVFFYVGEYEGLTSVSFGTESADKPRVPRQEICP